MRVIAGSARRLLLMTPKGNETRPTSDKIKETLFNCLMPYLPGSRFLDLYAGSGGIGIEALSRGAKEAVFVENGKEACACIKRNLETTHFQDRGILIKADVSSSLRNLEAKGFFDIIFMDPPYDHDYEKSNLIYLSQSSLVFEDTLIVIEASKETDFTYLDDLGFEIIKIKDYKSNKHVFIKKK